MAEKKKKEFGEYYLGLDIGTNSVGWAVTDTEYNLLEFNRKAMWGIHLFKGGETAETRRLHRCSRRRLNRRNQRLMLLRELFDEEITAVDPSFYSRLQDSSWLMEDREEKQKNTLFNDQGFTDKEYFRKYPTIYHLRQDLMNTKTKPDIRLVYLAVHHILKHRGHFLFEGLSDDDSDIPEFKELFTRLMAEINAECDAEFSISETIAEVEELFLNKELTASDKSRRLQAILSAETEAEKAICNLLAGLKTPLSKVFSDESYKDLKVTFKDTSFEDSREELENALGETYFGILDLMKQTYDWSILKSLLGDHNYLSDSKVATYEQHKQDLVLLKAVLKEHSMKTRGDMTLYHEVLKSNTPDNYCAYSGVVKKVHTNTSGSKKEEDAKAADSEKTKTTKFQNCNQDQFCKYLKKILEGFDFTKDKFTSDMGKRIEDCTFMPKQKVRDNSIVPNNLHRRELSLILENTSRFHPFLSNKDSDGLTVKDKIMSLCTFRIPYYVGPLNKDSERAWAVRKTEGRAYPWNFENVIDIDRSAIAFIEEKISHCTYLVGEKVLPKRSVLYARFELYNELNNISINGERISPELKSSIVRDLFETGRGKKVSVKKLKTYIDSKYGDADVEVTGLNDSIKSNIDAELQVRGIIGDTHNRKIVDTIIERITVFGDDRKRLRSKLTVDFGEILPGNQIEALSKLRFADWGRLSEKLLIGIYHSWNDGRSMNILTALEQTNNNLEELLSKRYTYTSQIESLNAALMPNAGGDAIDYSIVKDLYCSPAVKRSIWRALSITKDILKITGHAPKKIFIETTREKIDNRKVPDSRKTQLEKLYSKHLSPDDELVKALQGTDEARLRGRKIYTYYAQLGKCMYCGRKIDLNDIGEDGSYDLDHIWPQSVITDDSIHNNLVLTCKSCNQSKGKEYPIKEEIQSNMRQFWTHLREKEFITKEKYERLIRPSPFSDDELSGFIKRQLVETGQSVKAVAKALENVFGKDSDIVYVKGKNVSSFRQDLKFIKSRNVNDYHHAEDAYLNIVVGNVYDVKFTKDPLNFIKNNNRYSLGNMFDRDVSRNGVTAWIAGEDGTASTVKKHMRRNNILYTRYPYKASGQLYDVQLMSKGKGQWRSKENRGIDNYGGYNKVAGSYFALVEHTLKKKRVRTLEPVPIVTASRLSDKEAMDAYFTSEGLQDPDVRVQCIRMDSMFCADGFRMTVSGRTSNNILYMCAEQLILPIELYNYCKKLYNFNDTEKTIKSEKNAADYQISIESNLNLYNELMSKLDGYYGKLKIYRTQIDTLRGLHARFIDSTAEVQAKALSEMLHIFQCNPLGMNLKMLGGPGNAGRIIINRNITDFDSIILVNQSPSGLFETYTDLKKI